MRNPIGILAAAVLLLGAASAGLADVPRQSPVIELFTNTS